MKKCDVIIPVYNAVEATKECIESVIECTEFDGNKLIIINDASPDKAVKPMLNSFKNYDFIEILQNEKNLGFVGTVNRGMKYSNNDVVLLNSDTVVTKNWLKKMMNCAYSEKSIGTVTPLSNNATLVSVPIGLQRNELPTNISLENYGDLVEKIAYNENQYLPTAHGFCMYIKREVLDLIGFFDEKAFGKGYGEENDFSFRCLDYGFKNVLCDNTIIFHKEKQSFSSAREKLVEEHMKILENRYPMYSSRIGIWCRQFPIKKMCENIDYQLNMYNRKNILFIIHDWNDKSGGTTLHALDLINSLRKYYNFHVLTMINGVYKVYSYFEHSEKEMNLKCIENYSVLQFYNQDYRKMVEQLIDALRIDVVHIHHMINHYFDLADVLKEKKVYSVITLHDFYSLCPTINMLYKTEKYCGNMKEKNCAECLQYKNGIKNDIIPRWRTVWNEFLSKMDKIIVPSNSTKNIINKVYDNIKIDAIPHGVKEIDRNYDPIIENKLNVAFVGVVSIHKGGKVLDELIKKKDRDIIYHLFGKTEFESLSKTKSNYVNHGAYEREELSELLRSSKINLACLFSIWPETYSYTLTECIQNNIPVLTFDIGAIAERIKENNLGYVIPLNSSIEDIRNIIIKIKNDTESYNKIVDNIKAFKIKSIEDMAKEYNNIYKISKIIDIDENSANALKEIIENNFGVHDSIDTIMARKIMNSLKWRLVSKIKVPNSVKKIIRKVVK